MPLSLLEQVVYWVVMPIIITALVAINLFILYKYGEWLKIAKSKLVVVLARRDGTVKLVPADRNSFGDFVELGNPGKVLVEPEYLYRLDTRTRNIVMFVYEPIAQNVPLQKVKWDELEKRVRATLSPRRIDELVNYKAMELYAGKRGLGFNPMLLIIAIVFVILAVAFLG